MACLKYSRTMLIQLNESLNLCDRQMFSMNEEEYPDEKNVQKNHAFRIMNQCHP